MEGISLVPGDKLRIDGEGIAFVFPFPAHIPIVDRINIVSCERCTLKCGILVQPTRIYWQMPVKDHILVVRYDLDEGGSCTCMYTSCKLDKNVYDFSSTWVGRITYEGKHAYVNNTELKVGDSCIQLIGSRAHSFETTKLFRN
jgi:hypothetical protein